MSRCGYVLVKTVQGISSNYWFHSLKKRVKRYIDNCVICMMTNDSSNVKEGDMQITETPTFP